MNFHWIILMIKFHNLIKLWKSVPNFDWKSWLFDFYFLVLVRSEAKDIHNSDSPPKEWKVLSVLFAMYLHRQLQRVFATWITFWGSIRDHTIYIIHDYYSEKRMHRILNRKMFIVSFHQFINCWIHKQSNISFHLIQI